MLSLTEEAVVSEQGKNKPLGGSNLPDEVAPEQDAGGFPLPPRRGFSRMEKCNDLYSERLSMKFFSILPEHGIMYFLMATFPQKHERMYL